MLFLCFVAAASAAVFWWNFLCFVAVAVAAAVFAVASVAVAAAVCVLAVGYNCAVTARLHRQVCSFDRVRRLRVISFF
jgi:hypothetical protein